MVWPIYLSSAAAMYYYTARSKTSSENAIASAPLASPTAFFYCGIFTGLSLGYILTTELRRLRIWEYWRLCWQSYWNSLFESQKPETSTTRISNTTYLMEENDCSVNHDKNTAIPANAKTARAVVLVEHIISPKTHRTSQFHVDVITLPPLGRMIGHAQGVEWYHVVKGTIEVKDRTTAATTTASNNGDNINSATTTTTTTSSSKPSFFVVNPFVERTIYNPSCTTTAIVHRATDGPTKDKVMMESSTLFSSSASYTKVFLDLWATSSTIPSGLWQALVSNTTITTTDNSKKGAI